MTHDEISKVRQWLDRVRYNGKTYLVTMRAEDNDFGLLGLQPEHGKREQIFVEPEEVTEVWEP